MSGRSSRPETVVLALGVALAACSGKQAKAPEADPAEAKALAAKMSANMPLPSATRLCTEADFKDVVPITYRSIRILAGERVPGAGDFRSEPTLAAWTNPSGLEAPTLQPLLDEAASAVAKRRAAATLVGAKALVVYAADAINAAIALQVKHLTTGTIHARAIRFERGMPICVQQVEFQNTPERAEWAIARSDKPIIDPEVAQAMRDDLVEQYIKHAPTTAKK